MRGTLVNLLCVAAVAMSGCATKRPLPPAPLGSAGEAAAPGEDDAFGDRTDAATAALQRDLASAAGSDRVLFALDAHELSATARQTLLGQAGWLRQHPRVNFTIEGHCDERGTREYNLALGDRRAKSAADFLIAQGIAASRIRTISYGKERPEALASDDGSYARNRRAVSIVVRAD